LRGKPRQIFEALKEAILKGDYPNGALLPPEESLAGEQGVSRPTIAKVYNQLQDQGLIKKTRGFGSQVIYRAEQRTSTIGLLFPGAGESEIFTHINDELLKLAASQSVRFLWEGASANDAAIRHAQVDSYCDSYLAQAVDAILFSPLERLPDADAINLAIVNKIVAAGIPLVLVDRGIKEQPEQVNYDLVWMDNYAAGATMARHLIRQGCERLLFFHRPDSANSVNLRLAGVSAAAAEHQLAFTAAQVVSGDPADTGLISAMPILPGKTGIVCANDSTAAILLATLETIGVKVTEDCLICGFDNMKYAQYLKYPLTTYTQPCAEMARMSIELALRRIQHPGQVPITVSIGGTLIERASTQFKRPNTA
jgi:DNA-binding LacI/PurR family transcriptional regulator